ncbi:MAG: hypothetical protein WD737_03335 [Gemmatimonadota bacterium]
MNANALPLPARLSERLQLYARYVALVAEQLAALREDRPYELTNLEEERAGLEARLQDTDGRVVDDTITAARLDEFLSLGLAALQEDVDGKHALEDRWARLSDGAIRSARVVAPPRIPGGSYPETRSAGSRLDRRL